VLASSDPVNQWRTLNDELPGQSHSPLFKTVWDPYNCSPRKFPEASLHTLLQAMMKGLVNSEIMHSYVSASQSINLTKHSWIVTCGYERTMQCLRNILLLEDAITSELFGPGEE